MFEFSDPLIYLFNLQLFLRAIQSWSRALELTQGMMMRFVFLVDLTESLRTKWTVVQWRHHVPSTRLRAELLSALCSHLSETCRLFATQMLGDAWKWNVFSHCFNLYFIFLFYQVHCFLPGILNTARNSSGLIAYFSFYFRSWHGISILIEIFRFMLLPDQWYSPVCLLGTVLPLNGALPSTADA